MRQSIWTCEKPKFYKRFRDDHARLRYLMDFNSLIRGCHEGRNRDPVYFTNSDPVVSITLRNGSRKYPGSVVWYIWLTPQLGIRIATRLSSDLVTVIPAASTARKQIEWSTMNERSRDKETCANKRRFRMQMSQESRHSVTFDSCTCRIP